ncbi:MAG: serine hydroxymethyltransferase [Campylobacterales bacterium]|nr:serine hydroxymethyltransferase [Campylobacterales bacterium]
MSNLKQVDEVVYNSLQNEFQRQQDHLEMIASENFTYPAVMEVMGSVFTNKYAEGYPGKRYYGGCEYADEVEQLAIDRVCELFGCQFANVQPHSGSQANTAVYSALLKPYDKILGMDLSHGGHLTHGSKVSFTGKNYQSFFYGVNDEGLIDYDEVERRAMIVKPNILVAGFSAYSRELDFKRFREIADKCGAILMADIAHVAGLVAAGEYPSPFPHCDVVTSTTHKTLRGPRGGIILTNDEEIATKVNKAVFPGMQGGPLVNVIAAKAVAFGYNLQDGWKIYIKNVKRNIKKFAEVMMDRGYDIVSGGTDNHLVLVSFLNKDFSGKDADEALSRACITINKNTVPGETRSPFVTSGIRVGSPALTARGMGEDEFAWIGNKVADILDDIDNTELQDSIAKEVKELGEKFKLYDSATF